MGKALIDQHDALLKRRTVGLFEDFNSYTDGGLWTKGTTGGGSTVACTDNANGLLTLTTGGTVNCEAWVATTRKNWLIANNIPLLFEAHLNYQEANTNKAGVFAGFASTFAAAELVDTTLTPLTSFSGAAIYKVQGSTVWQTISSLGSTQTPVASVQSCLSTNDQVLRVEITPVTSTVAEVTFWVNGVQLQQSSSRGNIPIKHQLTYTGALSMAAGVFLKQGSGTAEVLNIDYIALEQLRQSTANVV